MQEKKFKDRGVSDGILVAEDLKFQKLLISQGNIPKLVCRAGNKEFFDSCNKKISLIVQELWQFQVF